MPTTVTRVEVLDIRFPTSLGRHGSDAMHPDPDYSAAYVILHTDRRDGPAMAWHSRSVAALISASPGSPRLSGPLDPADPPALVWRVRDRAQSSAKD